MWAASDEKGGLADKGQHDAITARRQVRHSEGDLTLVALEGAGKTQAAGAIHQARVSKGLEVPR